MNKTDRTTSPCQTANASSIDSVLLTLNAESDALSSDIVDRLAKARSKALMLSSQSHTSANATAIFSGQTSPCGKPLNPDGLVGRFNRLLQTIWNTPQMSASLATCGIASLAAILVANSAWILNDPAEGTPITTQQTELAKPSVNSATENPVMKVVSMETASEQSTPIMVSEENLDLVGSVDFLLWLDSQQG